MRTTWSLRLPSGYRYVRPGGNMSPAAGTVEMLSLGIEAKLEQLKRLERSYRDVAGSYGRKGKFAKKNWDTFNVKIGDEISQAQTRLDNYRGQISVSDYERLRGRLGEQKQQQDALMGSNSAFIVNQEAQTRNDLNAFLNSAASNPGVAEIMRNQALIEKPGFLANSEEQQIDRLEKELEVSVRELNVLNRRADQSGPVDRPQWKVSSKTGGKKSGELLAESVSKGAEMSRRLGELEREHATQIDRKQALIKGQLEELKDNRLARHFQRQQDGQEALALQSEDGYATRFGVIDLDESGMRPQSQFRAGPLTEAEYNDQLPAVRPRARVSVSGVTPIDDPLYVASGTYSLPVMLPAGEVTLNFTRHSGGAKLSLWAISESTLSNLYGSMIVIAGLLVIVGLVTIWPQSYTWRQLSAGRIIAYVMLPVILTLLLGLLGAIVALVVILLSEAKRGAFARQAAV